MGLQPITWRVVFNLPPITRRVVKRVGGIGAVDTILPNLVLIILVPELLERYEVLLAQILGVGKVVKVNRITAGVALYPAVCFQSTLPVAVVARIDAPPRLVIARSRGGSEANSADPLLVPSIKEVLLGGRAGGAVQRNVVVLRLRGRLKRTRRARLQPRDARPGAVHPRSVHGRDAVPIGPHLVENLVGQARRHRRRASSLRTKNAHLHNRHERQRNEQLIEYH
mmetsp:Transcript_23582/g.66176  ORF Transcript_23582/g.66176 Transcript_23582/m.66176 type:complete len:225 (+) Transcript_23582:806-1480(+)